MKRLNFFWIKVLFTMLSLSIQLNAEEAADEQMVITSGEADYNGQEINLIGKVEVQHGLGKISAHRLTVLPSATNKKSRFSLLKINEDIVIELQGGGQLQCQQAEVDYSTMKGFFLGNSQYPDVIYSHKNEKSEQSSSSLIVKSEQMEVDLVRQQIGNLFKTLVQSIQSNNNVRVYYNQEYLLLADQALYQRLPSQIMPMGGLLTLSVQPPHLFCQLTHVNGDQIKAYSIRVDTAKRLLYLDQPVGVLSVLEKDEEQKNIHFKSDELIWDDKDLILYLKGHISLDQNEKVHVKTDHNMHVEQMIHNGKKEIRSIFSTQETELTYRDSENDILHKVICWGPLTIDHERHEMWMQSPQDSQENVIADKQVYIEDSLGDMYADQMYMAYSWEQGKFVPVKLVLEGHVQMINRFAGHVQEAGSILQYALADRVEYFPATQEIFLSGLEGKRVLFFDKINNVKMSAPALKIRRDEKNQKSSIQGIGEVRFTFIERELDQLRQQFRLDEQATEN